MYLVSLHGQATSGWPSASGIPTEWRAGTHFTSSPAAASSSTRRSTLLPMRAITRIEATTYAESVISTPNIGCSASRCPITNGITYMVRPRMLPSYSLRMMAFISDGSIQLLVGPASFSSAEQMKVRSSTRATSVGSEAQWNELGFLVSSRRVKVPVATSASVSSVHSSSEPVHQWTSRGRVSSAISLTQLRIASWVVGAVLRSWVPWSWVPWSWLVSAVMPHSLSSVRGAAVSVCRHRRHVGDGGRLSCRMPSQQGFRPRLGQRYAESRPASPAGMGHERLDRSTGRGRDESHHPGGPGSAAATSDLHVSTGDRPVTPGGKGRACSGRNRPALGSRRPHGLATEPISERAPGRAKVLRLHPALVAQRIEHLTTDQKVGGSNPSERANRTAQADTV